MKTCRCLLCNKVLGEVEGKARIKCKMARCGVMNVIDTDADTHIFEEKYDMSGVKVYVGSVSEAEEIERMTEQARPNGITRERMDELIIEVLRNEENERKEKFAVDILNNGFTQHVTE